MRHTVATLGLLSVGLLPSCACGSSLPGDAGIDAPLAPDVPADAASDFGTDSPRVDAPITAPICGDIVATSCPTQSAATVTACGASGVVYFDGTHCAETPRQDCDGAERGAFASFEECAVVCEAAGECDGSKLEWVPTGEMPGCLRTPGIPAQCVTGAVVRADIALDAHRCLFDYPYVCDELVDGWMCLCFDPPRPPAPPSDDDLTLRFRRLSLLSFVTRLECTLPE